ncbi:MAG: nitrate reductase [Aquamicrobium sp.]|uniref:nitrate reductase n=1 Tax=Aquamicrobium sp. TaxID=1872579 RepID=UPI00349EFD7D|nr:nitrate reductase [Aquamicrobium sp.]MCO5155556.1 nitrate reductase [Aquamicrobium sp.]
MNRLANPFAPRRALPEKTRQIKAWVRALCSLDETVVVSVTELACRDEDCPDIETVIGIMRPGEAIETVRVHRPVAGVTQDDLALAVRGGNRQTPGKGSI